MLTRRGGPLSLVKSLALVAGLVPLEGDPAGRGDAALRRVTQVKQLGGERAGQPKDC